MRASVGTDLAIHFEASGDITAHTVTVERADRTPLSSPATSTVDEHLEVILSAADHLDTIDRLTVTISCTTADGVEGDVISVDVVGASWISLGQLRKEPTLNDLAKYSDQLLIEVRDEWESWIEELCRVRFSPGLEIEFIDSYGDQALELTTWRPRSTLRVLQDGVPIDITDAKVTRHGQLIHPTRWPQGELEVHIIAGEDFPPAKLVRELKKAVRREIMQRAARVPTDAISETSPDGGVTVRFSTPDPSRGRYTGILSLDPVIEELRRPRFGVG